MISFKTHKLIQESFGAFALGLARPNRIGGPIGSQFAEEEFGSETDDEDDEDDDSEESETDDEGDGDITSGGEPEGDFDFPPDNPEDGEDPEMGGEFGDEMGGEFGGDMGDDEEMDPAAMMGMSGMGGDEFGGPNLDDLDASGEFGDDEEMDPAAMMGMSGMGDDMDGMPMPDDEMGVPPMGDDDEMGSMGMGDGGAGMEGGGGDDEIADLIGGIDPALLGDESEEDMDGADMEGGDLEGEMGDEMGGDMEGEMGDDEEVEDPNQMMAMMRSYMSSGKNKKFMNKDCGPKKKNCLPAKFMKKEDTGDDFLRSLASQARGNHRNKNKSGLRNEDSLLAPLNTVYDNEPKAGQVGHSPQQRIGGIGGGYQMSDFDLPTLGESTESLPTIREYMEWKAKYRKGRKS